MERKQKVARQLAWQIYQSVSVRTLANRQLRRLNAVCDTKYYD